jgi:hypothetical protein
MKIPVSPRTIALRKVSQGQILSIAERESLIPSDLFLLASQSKLALTDAEFDRLKPQQLFELAAAGRITLRARDLERLTPEQRKQLQG